MDPAPSASKPGPLESAATLDFLAGGGETGALIRAHDWASTPLGDPQGWPQSLRTAVGLMLQARQPIYIAWGPALTSLYNDGYIPICGAKHPAGLGLPFAELWQEIMSDFGPIVEATLAGEAQWFEDLPIGLAGRKEREVGWFSFSYTPLRDERGDIAGFFCAAIETTNSVLAARRLADENHRFAQLFEQAPTFMAMLRGPDHVIEFANPGYLRLIGEREVIGKSVAQALPEVVEQGYVTVLDEVYRSGKAYVANGARYVLQRGADARVQERYVDFVYQPIRNAAGEVTGIFVEGVDVTARALADQELRASEARLRELNSDLERRILEISNERSRTWLVSPDLLGVLNAQGFFERSNPAWEAVLGWSEEEVTTTSIFELLHPDDVANTRAGFELLTEHDTPALRFENRYRCKSGGYRWLSWVGVPEGGKFYCSARDITDAKEQAAQLAERTAERDRVWNNSRDLLVVIGADGIFRSVNPAWTAILGHEPSEVVGRSFLDFVWPDDAGLTQGGLDAATSKRDLDSFENRYRHKDATARWISWHTAVEGDLVYAYGRDITLQREAQAQLAAAQDALRQAQKMEAIGQLTGGVAHDFNNLLQVISANLHLVDKHVVGNEKAQARLSSALGAVQRGAKLAGQLLAFGRRQALEPRIIKVGRFVAGMEDMLRRSLGDAIEVETIISGGLWNTFADPAQTENALLNLAINARDAMNGAGKLTIEVGNAYLDLAYARSNVDAVPGQYVMLAVSDTGTGMAPEVMAQAFDPFFSTKPPGSGTGLGLSMVYGFVKQSGGHVKIYSELGHGTTMKLYLPRAHQREEAAEPIETDTVSGGSETILVVEDDDGVRSTTVEMLRDLGYRVLAASDAASALAIVETGVAIDLLFTDVVMPGPLTSTELARRARRRLPRVAVLFASGYAPNAIVHGGRLDEGVELLPKPYTQDVMARRIRSVLENRTKPAAAEPQAGTVPPPGAEAAASAPRLVIMLIEDDEHVRSSTAGMLQDLGHAVVEVGNAEDAMSLLRKVPIDVLLTDLGLPGVSGEAFAAAARALKPGLRIVFATGGHRIPELAGAGISPVLLHKPYDTQGIAAALRAAQRG